MAKANSLPTMDCHASQWRIIFKNSATSKPLKNKKNLTPTLLQWHITPKNPNFSLIPLIITRSIRCENLAKMGVLRRHQVGVADVEAAFGV